MKAKDKVKEFIDNIKGKKEDKTTIEKTNTINIGPSISSIEAIINEQDFNKRMDMYRAAHYNFGMIIAAEESRNHSPINNGQTMKEAIDEFDQNFHDEYLAECNKLAEMDDNDRIDYYNKHGFNVAQMAQYESTINEVIEKNQAETEAIRQIEQKAKDDQDYFAIIECGQNPPGPNYISAEEAMKMDMEMDLDNNSIDANNDGMETE